ncbi:MAG TPA: hypothetical protein VFD35_12860 [Pricia sp.]|nr:hypothetical protein [Pricia sp.]
MERIVIQVADDTAKKWRTASPELRETIEQELDIRIAKKLMANSKEEFQKFLDEIRLKVKDRGLTEEILPDILNEDD